MRDVFITVSIKVFDTWLRATLPFLRVFNPPEARRAEQLIKCMRQIAETRTECDRICQLLDTDLDAGMEALEDFRARAERIVYRKHPN